MDAAEIHNRKKQIKEWALEYEFHRCGGRFPKKGKGKIKLFPTEENGIQFYVVGHNSSHEFYLGVDDDGHYWKMSCGESWSEDNQDYSKLDRSITKLDSLDNQYFGHY